MNIQIPYDAVNNYPNSFSVSNITFKWDYEFHLRICSEVGCSKWTDSILIQSTKNPIQLLDILIPCIAVGIVLTTVLIAVVLLSLIIIILCKIPKRKQIKEDSNIMELNDFGSFTIEESKIDFTNSIILGSGASGSVFTAKYFNNDVAVKIINKTCMGMENDLTDFYNELQFLNRNAQHQNIIRFFGVYESIAKNSIGLVMEYCCNGSIASYISHQSIDFETKVAFLKGIAKGMQYLHHHNIAHRDLKCENVLLDSSLTPKIIDFGYSREIQDNANQSLNLTMTVGTAAYCAPDVIRSQLVDISQHSTAFVQDTQLLEPLLENTSIEKKSLKNKVAYDKKCDVYSFAIVIFVIYFQNKTPYGNINDAQILIRLGKNPNTRPKFNELSIPEDEKWLIDLMKHCWKTNPDERPSFEQICKRLEYKK